jgi:hypothetical protein
LKGRGAADRAASLLIRKHGANAELEAAKRADLMLPERGDDDGPLLWARVRRAIEALRAVPGQTELSHRRSGPSDFCRAVSNNKEWWQQKR